MMLEEKLIFEIGSLNKTAIDLENPLDIEDFGGCRLGEAVRDEDDIIGLYGLSEPEVVRHYTRLSQKNYAVDSVFYPLGSCTMKYNPRINEKIASLKGFYDVHPFAPENTMQGCLEVLYNLTEVLKTLTGMEGVCLSPAAGANGELCGMMTIHLALQKRGEDRKVVLIPASAHGTNPATAAMCGFKIEQVPVNPANGRVDIDYLEQRLALEKGKDVAAFMLTNPNTCGLFETDVKKMGELVHKAGAFFYMDGANFNAIMGVVRPVDFGVDAMHINVHKTFSTPHGGGGPGAGPVVFASSLVPFMPLPQIKKDDFGVYHLCNEKEGEYLDTVGWMKEFYGQFSVLLKTLVYIMSMGSKGLKQAAYDAVLNANYVREKLKGFLHLPFDEYCMHEVLFDDSTLQKLGMTTVDLAKNLIDAGFHPMTMYFPLVVHGAILIEPTETESKYTLDNFIEAIKIIVKKAEDGNIEKIKMAPVSTCVNRLDETKAAREPRLVF